MDSTEATEVTEAVVQEEAVVAEQPLAEEQAPGATNQVEQKQEKSEEGNWRLIRERQKLLERERDEARQQLQQYQQSAHPQAKPQEEAELAPDDIPEWKHVQKKFKKLEDQIKGYQQQSAESAVEVRLKTQYHDFDSVVNKDNLESLRIAYPELAATINTSSDLYSKASAAYTMIKKMGIVPDSHYDKDKETVNRNHGKPRPLTSVSPQEGAGGPLSKANAFADGLTPDLKKQLFKEMIDARKKY